MYKGKYTATFSDASGPIHFATVYAGEDKARQFLSDSCTSAPWRSFGGWNQYGRTTAESEPGLVKPIPNLAWQAGAKPIQIQTQEKQFEPGAWTEDIDVEVPQNSHLHTSTAPLGNSYCVCWSSVL